ncbi:MAG: ADP-ribosylglycohydrolase family protein [Verrucomicrobiota bacterium]
MLSSRISGCLWGAVIGDALGVPVEFEPRSKREADPVREMRGFGTHRQPPGTWSDDSSLLLTTVESLLAFKSLDPRNLGERFVKWAHYGNWSPHGQAFDIGTTTRSAIERIAEGTPAHQAGARDEQSNGNGSLMRIAPIALAFWSEAPQLVIESASLASSLTHRHPRSRAACAWFCLLLRELLTGQASLPQALLDTRMAFLQHAPSELKAEYDHFQRLRDPEALTNLPQDQVQSTGYVLSSLEAALWCALRASDYTEAVLLAVNLGDDTDTTACIAGALAGCLHGIDTIPNRWSKPIARRRDVGQLIERAAATWDRPAGAA